LAARSSRGCKTSLAPLEPLIAGPLPAAKNQ
jgi:hypothetical protein